jgi:hypothetical protein
MTSTSPSTAGVLHDVATAYRTCEFATTTRAGVPLAWPAVCLVAPDAGTITLTTSVALPRKALNIRRDPRVGLLFSDPTGTGRDDLPQVLVRGTATCPEEIHTSPAGLEEYWLRLWERQPDAVDTSNALMRRLMDFYFFRLVITLTPREVVVRPPLVRPGARTAAPAAPARADDSAWAQAARRLPAYADGVLGTMAGTAAAGELPDLHRVRVVPDERGRLLRLEPADGEALAASGPTRQVAGLAGNLMFHGHDERLSALRQFAVTGRIVADRDGWALRPERFVPGAAPESPLQMARTVVRLRRTARDYLAARGLPRPAVDWAAFGQLRARSTVNP